MTKKAAGIISQNVVHFYSMDYYTILAQKANLEKEFLGRTVDAAVSLKDTHHLFIGFAGHDRAVKLSCVPDMPYLSVIERRYIPKRNAKPWHQSRFANRKVTGISVTPNDRIITITVETGARVVFEMTGRHANIITVNPDGTIAGAFRKVGEKESAVREIRTGVPYEPPPPRDFPDLVWGALPGLEKRLLSVNEPLGKAFQLGLSCGSRFFALEVCARAGFDPGGYAADLSKDDLIHLLTASANLAALIESGGDGASIVFRGDGIPQDVFPARMETTEITHRHFDSIDEAVTEYAREREISLERRSLKNAALSALKREQRTILSTIKKVERERGGTDEPERLERLGNTLLANLHKVAKGMARVTLTDPYEGGEIEVDLDPRLDGSENAQKLFKRSGKLRAASKLAGERLAELSERLEQVTRERETLEQLEDVKELRKAAGKYIRYQTSGGKREEDERFPRRFRSKSGLEIIVGRNDRENDDLVRWARKTDLWLHAQNIGGSHVILRTIGRDNPDRQSIEQASAIAAYYSQARTSGLVPVACTQVKYVTKRKGQGSGKVTYVREKVIFAEPGLPKHSVDTAAPDTERT